MSRHKGALPETYVVGSQPIYEDETVKLASGEELKTGRKVHKLDLAQALFTAAGKPVGERLLKQVPAWTGAKVVGTLAHFINEAAKRRCHGDKRLARPEELVQVPLLQGMSARLASQLRYGARVQRRKEFGKRVLEELAKRKAAADAAAAGAEAAQGAA